MTHTGSTEAAARTGDTVTGTSPTDLPRTGDAAIGSSHADLLTAVREAAAEVLGTTPDAIVAGTDLRAEYGIDSLELMSIGAHLERALNVQISAEDLVRAETVGQAVELLAQRKADRT
ncbi:acyl carrier protein [Streptomyces sp. NPDC001922]|uniref:acyl carrier protein n=1 Tax=Streptomyces sp. NPDC001922 TaxID=3364624 RepID=UPI003679B8C1